MKAELNTYVVKDSPSGPSYGGPKIGEKGNLVLYAEAERVIEELEATIEKKDKDILKLTEIIANAISEGSLKIATK